jgi:hypothetical protein
VTIVDGGKLWGKSFYKWRQEYFRPLDFKGFKWGPQYGTLERLTTQLNTVAFRVDESQLSYQKTMLHSQIPVQLPPKARSLYEEMEKEMSLTVEDVDITAFSAAAASMKIRQLAQGFVYDEYGDAHVVHTEKAHALADLIDEMDRALGLVAPKKLGSASRPALVATLVARFLESRMLSRQSFRTTQGWYDFSSGCGVQRWTRHFGVDPVAENAALESGKRKGSSVFDDVWPYLALFECASDASPLVDEGQRPLVLLDLRAGKMLLVKNSEVTEVIDVEAAYVIAGRRLDALLQTIGTHLS